MAGLTTLECLFLGTVLEGIIYGIYSVVFILYMKLRNKGSGYLLVYPLTFMFVLCGCFICLDFTEQIYFIFRQDDPMAGPVTTGINITTSLIYSVVDFTSQCVLIYRCWILWAMNPLVIVLPAFLAFGSFCTAITLVGEQIILGRSTDAPVWFNPLAVGSFSTSLAVNTIVTGMIVVRLVLVQREMETTVHIRRSLNLWPLIAIIAESGMLTFFGELCWVVLFKLQLSGNNGFSAVGGPVTVIYGLTPTLVLVRVALGRSIEPRSTVVHSTIGFATSAFATSASMPTEGNTVANSFAQPGEKNKSSLRLNQSSDMLASEV